MTMLGWCELQGFEAPHMSEGRSAGGKAKSEHLSQTELLSLTENLIQAPIKYAKLEGDANLVYDAICKALSEREHLVDWDSFGNADWTLFAQMAENEGVAPLLYWHLGKLGNWELGECRIQNSECRMRNAEVARQKAEVPLEVKEFYRAVITEPQRRMLCSSMSWSAF
jgi:hypothetical protein